jgi:lipopolysaccharide export LptBFGC system permease protein LptF
VAAATNTNGQKVLSHNRNFGKGTRRPGAIPVTLFRYLLYSVLLRVAIALPSLGLVYLAFYLGDEGRRLAAIVGLPRALEVAVLHLPLVLVQIAPVAVLLGIVLTLSTLRQRGELEAIASLGEGPARVLPPLLLAGLLGAGFAAVVDETLVPPCERLAEAAGGTTASSLTGLEHPGRWIRQGPWFIREGEGGAQLAVEVDPAMRPLRRLDRPAGSNRTRVTTFPEGDGPFVRADALAPPAPLLEASRTLRRLEHRAESLSSPELARRISLGAAAGQAPRVEALVLFSKLAHPLFCLAFALLAGPFALGHRARTLSADLARAVLLSLAGFLLLAAGWSLGRSGLLPAPAGVFGPLALLTLIGALWTLAAANPRRPPVSLAAGQRR